jgi:hypothetical protein
MIGAGGRFVVLLFAVAFYLTPTKKQAQRSFELPLLESPMASRENQGYLIAVIVLVLLSLVLALAAFLAFSKVNEYADNKQAAEQKLAVTEKLLQANEIRSGVLKAMIGVGESSMSEAQTQIDMLNNLPNQVSDANGKKSLQDIHKDVTDIKAMFDRAVKAGSAGNEGAVLTFLSTIDNLNASVAKMNVEYKVKENQAVFEEQEAQRKIREMEAQVANAEKEKQQAEQDLATEKEARRADQSAHQLAMNEAAASLQRANENHAKARELLNEELSKLRTEEAALRDNNTKLVAKVVEFTQEVFDSADGQVVKVFPGTNMVYIDLGRVHALPPNISFSVYDRAVTNYEKGKHKATIEITRVMDNQSEGRITYEDPTDPILPGDWVLTPTWGPGQRVRFALAGVFDLDGDGNSDLEQMKVIIERNGGEVVCWHDNDGQIFGQIDSTIRYLALGEAPRLGVRANPAVVAAMSAMKNEAEANTIQIIDKEKLLQRMGVRVQGKMELLNRAVREGGFEPRTAPLNRKGDE